MEEELIIILQFVNTARLGSKTDLVQLQNQTEKKQLMQSRCKIKTRRAPEYSIIPRKRESIRNRANQEHDNDKTV